MAKSDYEDMIKFVKYIDDEMRAEFEFIDNIDLTDIINHYDTLSKVRDTIESMYSEDFCKTTGYNEIFNCISEEEFVIYLNRKYHAGFYEETRWVK